MTIPSALSGLLLALAIGNPVSSAPDQARPSKAADGTTYFVDSARGDDQSSGTAATGDGGHGPWRSLARLADAKLQPGDVITLACGSVWHETLRLAHSGVPGKPISVSVPPGGCATPPVIDGSYEIAPSAWTASAGQVRSIPLPDTPLSIRGPGVHWVVAHHPNAGADPAHRQSIYRPMVADGESQVQNGRPRGTSMFIGPHPEMPAGALGSGAKVHLRSNAWALESRGIASRRGNRIEFDRPTTYPARAAWGYFFSGEAWMVDAPGEWHFDPGSRLLRARWPGDGTPQGPLWVTLQKTGIDLRGRAHITVRGVRVQHVGAGIQATGSRSLSFQGIQVLDTAGAGLAAGSSHDLLIESSHFERTGLDAIQGAGRDDGDAVGMVVRGNRIVESAVRIIHGVNAALPVRAYAAVYAGPRAVIEDNQIRGSGYIGIRFMADSLVQRNLVEDSCLVLSDCGAIYTWGKEPNNSRVLGNLVQRSWGNLNGTPAGTQTAAQGIYLDDNTTGVLVEGNTVSESDHGIQVHIAQRNTVRRNLLFNNRRSQLWMQADRNALHPEGDVIDNQVIGNVLAATAPGSVPLLLHSNWRSTAQFGRFNGNHFIEGIDGTATRERTAQGTRDLSFSQWQASQGIGAAQSPDGGGSSLRALPYARHAIAGPSLVSIPTAGDSLGAWRSWNASGAPGALQREDCARGTCLRHQPGGSPGIVSSPAFPLEQGRWYRLTVDVLAEADRQPVRLVVRRAGAKASVQGSAYEVLSDRALAGEAGPTWKRKVFVFQALKSATPGARSGDDPGARIDFEGLGTGRSLRLANLELVPLATRDATLHGTVTLVNPESTAAAQPCPLAATDRRACDWLYRLPDQKPAIWPMDLAPRGGVLLYALDPSLRDTDRDGIADHQDSCASTAQDQPVNAAGCSLTQPP